MLSSRSRGAALAAVACSIALSGAVELSVPVDLKTGAYSVLVDGVEWLKSDVTSATSDHVTYTSAPGGGLVLAQAAPTSGQGYFGPYTGASLLWNVGALPGALVTNFFLYSALQDDTPFVIFEQVFPLGLNGTVVKGSDPADDLTASFPSFSAPTDGSDPELGYVSFHDVTIASAVGRWTKSSVNPGHFGSYGALLGLFNASGAALVLSPASDFMVSHPAFGASIGGAFGVGMGGALESIPPGWVHRNILAVGPSLNDTFVGWGDALLALGDKPRAAPDEIRDLHTSYLSYWNDNGAFYYYNTEPNATYQQTMLDVEAYLRKEAIPFRSLQFDRLAHH